MTNSLQKWSSGLQLRSAFSKNQENGARKQWSLHRLPLKTEVEIFRGVRTPLVPLTSYAPDLCFLPSCAMYKDNAVRNVVAEMGRDLVFMITARLSDLSMPLKGEVRRSPVQSARQPIARSGKFVRRSYSRRAFDCEKDDGLTCMYAFSCMLSPIVIVEHTSVWEGVGGRGEIWRGIPRSNTKDQLPKPQTATVATAQRPK